MGSLNLCKCCHSQHTEQNEVLLLDKLSEEARWLGIKPCRKCERRRYEQALDHKILSEMDDTVRAPAVLRHPEHTQKQTQKSNRSYGIQIPGCPDTSVSWIWDFQELNAKHMSKAAAGSQTLPKSLLLATVVGLFSNSKSSVQMSLTVTCWYLLHLPKESWHSFLLSSFQELH